MTRDEIILIADASGLSWYGMGKDRDKFLHYLEAFAALVAAAKPWTGLTIEEIGDIFNNTPNPTEKVGPFVIRFSRAIEAKLKEKTT